MSWVEIFQLIFAIMADWRTVGGRGREVPVEHFTLYCTAKFKKPHAFFENSVYLLFDPISSLDSDKNLEQSHKSGPDPYR